MIRRRAWLLALLLAGGCREGDGSTGPGSEVSLRVVSDPAGGRIFIDNRDSGFRAPATVEVRSGDHDVVVLLDTAGLRYSYGARLRIARSDTVLTLNAPLTLQCPVDLPEPCYAASRQHVERAGLRFAVTPRGAVFHWNGAGQGIFHPANSVNSYVANGLPVFAARANDGVRVALGMYDLAFFAGRPVATLEESGGTTRYTHTSWIAPPFHSGIRTSTVRGLEVEQEVIARDDVAQVVLVRLRFRNISDQPSYFAHALNVPQAPVTYSGAYIGMMLDPDIGVSGDDVLSYDTELDMAFAYDRDFLETGFVGGAFSAPALVGLRALRAPAGTTVLLNGYAVSSGLYGDWYAGTSSELSGWEMLTGAAGFEPQHPHPRIGHVPPVSGDVRLAVTAGPLNLAPGDEAEIVLAVAVADPVAGTFTSEQLLAPGDPLDTTRQLYAVAANLRARMLAAAALLEDQEAPGGAVPPR